MKSCIHCGAQLSDDDQFCLSCGADVEKPTTDGGPRADDVVNNEPMKNTVPTQPQAQSVPQYPPMHQQPVQPQPTTYQQPVQQYPPVQQQPVQPQPATYQQPTYQEPQQNRGSNSKVLLYTLIPLAVIGAVVAILFATGVFSGKKDAAKADSQEVTAQVQPSSDPEQSGEQEQTNPVQQSDENQPNASDVQNITLCGITFPLAPDYKVEERTTLKDSEACLIVPKGATDRSNRLILRIYPNELEGVNGITGEEIGDLLHEKLDANAGVLANKEKSGYNLDQKYKIHYDDNADGSYFPHCYTYLSWTDRNGKRSRSYSEATLVKRIVVTGTAVATAGAELRAFTDIYSEVVQSANE